MTHLLAFIVILISSIDFHLVATGTFLVLLHNKLNGMEIDWVIVIAPLFVIGWIKYAIGFWLASKKGDDE